MRHKNINYFTIITLREKELMSYYMRDGRLSEALSILRISYKYWVRRGRSDLKDFFVGEANKLKSQSKGEEELNDCIDKYNNPYDALNDAIFYGSSVIKLDNADEFYTEVRAYLPDNIGSLLVDDRIYFYTKGVL